MILTIGPGGCGFTFLNWSISYLRGDVEYKSLTGEIYPVISNPINGYTAHNSFKDHIRIEDSKELLNNATEYSIVYIVPGSQQDFEYISALPGKKIILDPSVDSRKLMARHLVCVKDSAEKYLQIFNKESNINHSTINSVLLDMSKFFMNYYSVKSGHDSYVLYYNDVMCDLEKHMVEIFEYLNLSLDQSRWPTWLAVYKDYKDSNAIDFESEIVDPRHISSAQKIKVFKELNKWKNGLFPQSS